MATPNPPAPTDTVPALLTLPEPPMVGPLAVAFSGGMDSTVLLHLLAHGPARGRGLRVLHVDHGLHPDSARWAEACAATCAELGLPFESLRAQVVDRGEGLEAAARRARHDALMKVQREGELIALAHHRDDQAETVLLRLLRASGDGLAGMRPLRPFGRGWLWRPLLAVAREQLRDYAERQQLAWIEDPSNASDRHDRNYLREHVMPALAARWPQAAGALARSAGLLAIQSDLLAAEDDRRLPLVRGLDAGSLSVSALRLQTPAWRDRLLRAWVRSQGLPPLPGQALATIAQDLLGDPGDSQPEYAWAGAVIRRWRDALFAGWPTPPLPLDWRVQWDGRAPLTLPTGDVLQLEPALGFESPVLVCTRQGGERMVQPNRVHSSELKQILQDLGLPPWQRARLPLVFSGDGELLAAGAVAMSARLQRWLAAHGARLRHETAIGPH